MADLELLLAREFRKRTFQFRKIKEGVIAEPVRAARSPQQHASRLAVKNADGGPIPSCSNDRNESALATIVCNAIRPLQQQAIVGFVRIGRDNSSILGVPSRTHAGLTPQ